MVYATGDRVYVGNIAESLRQEPPPSQFELEREIWILLNEGHRIFSPVCSHG
jgi:hypothetical protein